MKKSLFFGLTVLFTVSVLNGQPKYADKEHENKKEVKTERVALKTLEGTSVSVAAKENFAAAYGKVPDVKWKRGKHFDEATFSKDGKNLTAFYDNDGILAGTTQISSFAQLPAKGQQVIKSKYGDYTVRKVIFYEDNQLSESDMLLYGLQFDDADNYFVELSKGTKNIVLRVDKSGFVEYFASM